MAKLSVDQKRLEALRQQLYGKEKPLETRTSPQKKETEIEKAGTAFNVGTNGDKGFTKSAKEDSNYLKRDLTKILILSFIALTIQFGLFFAVSKGLVNLKIF